MVVLSDVDAIRISYQGLKPILVKASDPSSVTDRALVEGGTGIYEEIIDQKQIDNKDAAMDFAQGLLTRYGTIPSKVFIYTDQFKNAGKICKIEIPELDINGNYLITKVTINEISCGKIRYNIELASGQDFGSWVEFFRQFKPTDFTIRENEVLVRLETLMETENSFSSYTAKRFNPPVASETLFASETLIVGNAIITEVTIND
jgi:hypothetical protein